MEAPTRRLYRTISPLARRNARDDAHLRLLLTHGLHRDANCVDVGAHSGEILALIQRSAPDGHHVAFEPLPDQAVELRRRFPGVEVREAALSDSPGVAQFTHVVTNPQLSGLRDRHLADEKTATIEVAVERLDDCVDSDRPLALVKIDVEGAELQVLNGGIGVLERWRPTIVFEHGIGGADHYGATSGELHDLLAGHLGLRVFDIDGNGPYDRASFEALYTAPIWFFVAHR